jgi:hypothetical protein
MTSSGQSWGANPVLCHPHPDRFCTPMQAQQIKSQLMWIIAVRILGLWRITPTQGFTKTATSELQKLLARPKALNHDTFLPEKFVNSCRLPRLRPGEACLVVAIRNWAETRVWTSRQTSGLDMRDVACVRCLSVNVQFVAMDSTFRLGLPLSAPTCEES